MTTTWADVQRKAATPGSTVLANWNAERSRVKNATYSTETMESFGVYPSSAAGVSVTPSSAMRVSAVFACVQRIAGTIATLPLHVYERTNGARKRVDVPLWYLLNEAPTARYTAASHWEATASAFLLRGDGFTFIGRDAMGNIKELIPLPWEAVHVERSDDVGGVLKYMVRDVRNFGVDASDMLHFPGFGFSGIRSMSVIQYAARNAAGNALAMDEFSGKFFAGGAHPSIVLQTDAKMGADQIAKLQTAFANKYSGIDNAHRLPLVLTEGLKADTLSISAQDSQLLDARKFQVVDIARAFGVPPHLIGETSASTSWGSGIESMSRGFVTYTLQPHLKRIEQELNRKLWPTRTKYFVEFDRDGLIEGDSAAQASFYRSALGGPGSGVAWMTVDEVRAKKNLEPMGGEAAELYDPRDPVDKGEAPADPGPDANTRALVEAMRNAPAPTVNITNNLPEMAPTFEATVEAPVVNVASAIVPAPVVNVEAPVVNVAAAVVPAPVVNIVQQTPRKTEIVAEHDDRGFTTRIYEKEIE